MKRTRNKNRSRIVLPPKDVLDRMRWPSHLTEGIDKPGAVVRVRANNASGEARIGVTSAAARIKEGTLQAAVIRAAQQRMGTNRRQK